LIVMQKDEKEALPALPSGSEAAEPGSSRAVATRLGEGDRAERRGAGRAGAETEANLSRSAASSLLRVVAPNEQDAAEPDDSFPVHEAITRKVVNPLSKTEGATANPATPEPALESNKRTVKHVLVSALVAAGLAATIVVLWRLANRPVVDPASVTSVRATVPAEVKAQASPPHEMLAPPPTRVPTAETSHLRISVRQPQATLTLDDGAVEGNLLDADVAKDVKIHVVFATAPGFLPQKKIVRFANDVYLDIDLRKAPAPPRGAAKRRSLQSVAKARTEPKVDTPSKQAEEFGMTLERPTTRRLGKKIDEKDPYAP
jgi:hypothetical protein